MIRWETPQSGTQIVPSGETVALAVDVPSAGGGIRVFDRATGIRVTAVGTTHAGRKVIVRWIGDWWFRVLGPSTPVGYIEVSSIEEQNIEEQSIEE